jgi:hypothetical protein
MAYRERQSVPRIREDEDGEDVHVSFLTSTACLIQSRDGRVVIRCYRATPPTSLITWLTYLDVNPVEIKMPLPTSAREHDEYEVHGRFYRNVRSTRPEIIRLNPCFGALVGLDQGSTTRRPRPATQGAIR